MIVAEPIVDRVFAEKFLAAVDRPFDYGVYFLFHDTHWEAELDTPLDELRSRMNVTPRREEGLRRHSDAAG